MSDNSKFLSIDIQLWVFNTIKWVENGVTWRDAWQKSYFSLGGESKESAKKSCPMNGTKTLYLLGRIKGSNKPYRDVPIREIWEEYSKNGAYAILSLEILRESSNISIDELWSKVQERIRKELGEEPAKYNQGGPTIAYKLWHQGLIINP